MEYYLLVLLIGYIFGSIPFGLILARLFGYGDIRKIGSGNIGATNVLRTGNKVLAFFTLFLDIAKAIVPIILISAYLLTSNFESLPVTNAALICGLGAILGHCFPIWLKFKGGKGVATTFGVLLIAVPITGLAAALAWIMSALAARTSSLAALSSMVIAPAVTYATYGLTAALINCIISALVIFRHKDNIKRLMNGTEPKIGQKT